MPRYKCTLEYDGSRFSGWQKQRIFPTIQGEIEKAITLFSRQEVTIYTAGRTDAGVHAYAQVCHFDLDRDYPSERVMGALNFYLREQRISVLKAEIVPDNFHARFSAIGRHYRYHIVNRPAPLTFEKGYAWQVWPYLDVHAMQQAALFLLGTHDFTSFRDSQCQAHSAIKTVDVLTVQRIEDKIIVEASARSFLHHMVRNIVGTLVLVGAHRYQPEQVRIILDTKDRRCAGPTAPAEGLYFVRVDYPKELSITHR